MVSNGTSSVLGDIEFLTRSEHRVVALDALSERPLSRSELRAVTGASPSTISRMVSEFEDRSWVERDGHEYVSTRLGTFVVSGMTALIRRVEIERTLRDNWHLLPFEASELDVEAISGAVVTVAEADEPYGPVNRFASLLRETGQFRFVGFDLGLFEPCKDEFRRRIVDGMRTEVIVPPSNSRYILSTYPEYCSETIGSGNIDVLLHDDLPTYGLGLFDDRTAICGHVPDSGAVRVVVDTDDPAVREWAEASYESYRGRSRPLDFAPTA